MIQPVGGARIPISRLGRIEPARVSSSTPIPSDETARLLAASVRIWVEDPDGASAGSGTIIDARGDKALILTCQHIFSDYLRSGGRRITVHLFRAGRTERIKGSLIAHDSSRDLAFLVCEVPGPVPSVKVAPTDHTVDRGDPVVSIGCIRGADPAPRMSKIASVDRYLGPPNVQIDSMTFDGESGGGLFADGFLVGVATNTDPHDNEGLFASAESIRAMLDQYEMSFVYRAKVPASAVETCLKCGKRLIQSLCPIHGRPPLPGPLRPEPKPPAPPPNPQPPTVDYDVLAAKIIELMATDPRFRGPQGAPGQDGLPGIGLAGERGIQGLPGSIGDLQELADKLAPLLPPFYVQFEDAKRGTKSVQAVHLDPEKDNSFTIRSPLPE